MRTSIFFLLSCAFRYVWKPRLASNATTHPVAKITKAAPRNTTAINSVDNPITSSFVQVKLRIVGAVYQQLLLLTSRATADEYTYQ